MSIISTCNHGRLYIGIGENNPALLGTDIKCYKRTISKKFAKLFRNSIEITIAGKKRCVNKSSFKKHLQTIYAAECDKTISKAVKMLKNQDYYSFLEQNAVFITGNSLLRHSMPENHIQKLTKKLIVEFEKEELDVQKIKHLIRQGADLRVSLYVIDDKVGSDINADNYMRAIVSNQSGEIHTPLTFALTRNENELASFIYQNLEKPLSDKKTAYMLAKLSENEGQLTKKEYIVSGFDEQSLCLQEQSSSSYNFSLNA